MAFILTNVRLFAGGADLTSASSKVEISAEVEDKDVTNYGSAGYTEVIGGLASAEASAEGQWEAGDPALVDDDSWAALGTVRAWTVAPRGAAPGAVAYFTRALRCDYTIGGAVGDVAPWSSTMKSTWPLVRGTIAADPGTPRTADGAGPAQQLGAVAAGARLYAALHVLSLSDASITARVESSPDADFAEPTTVLTFDPADAPSGQVLRTTGDPVSDSYFRIAWDISGTAPSALLVAALGIA